MKKILSTKELFLKHFLRLFSVVLVLNFLFVTGLTFYQLYKVKPLELHRFNQYVKANLTTLTDTLIIGNQKQITQLADSIREELDVDKVSIIYQHKVYQTSSTANTNQYHFLNKIFSAFLKPHFIHIQSAFGNISGSVVISYQSLLTNFVIIPTIRIAFFFFLIWTLISALIFVLLFYKINKNLITPLNLLSQFYKDPDKNIGIEPQDQTIELHDLSTAVNSFIHSQAKLKLVQVSAQVAHDIRSPLTALDTVITSLNNTVPEQERIMMRTAFRRINNIANDLVNKYKGTEPDSNAPVFVYVAIKDILSEKDLEYNSKKIKIDLQLSSPHTAFLLTQGNYNEMRRMFSNLINNSINAMSQGGTIEITCGQDESYIIVTIRDEGQGISEEKLTTLLNNRLSNNTGLGLTHAKEYMRHYGGKLSLKSEEDIGTEISLAFKMLSQPSWLAEGFDIDLLNTVLLIDDDISIHDAWTKKFEAHPIKRLDCYSLKEAEASCARHFNELGLILCDYEFINETETGLDFLEKWQDLPCKKYLVTTHVDNKTLLNRCKKINLEIIPKHLLPYVNINIIQPPHNPIPEHSEIAQHIDTILIDDDEYNHRFWQYAADKKRKTLKCFHSLADFEAIKQHIALSTPIYIDLNLANNTRGLDVARTLKRHGFTKLYITTGFIDFTPSDYPWLAGVIEKDPPF